MRTLIYFFTLFGVLSIKGQSLASIEENLFVSQLKADSLHSSSILSVHYSSDTLYVTARYYTACCDNFVSYVDAKDNLRKVNFVVKSLERGCLCEVEKIMTHKVYAKNLKSDVQFRINGDKPKYGIEAYISPVLDEKTKKKNRKKM